MNKLTDKQKAVLGDLTMTSTQIRYLKSLGYRQCDVVRLIKANGNDKIIPQHVSNEWNRKAKQPKETFPGEQL